MTMNFIFCITPSQQRGADFDMSKLASSSGRAVGLVFWVFVPTEQPVAGRADGFIIGAQASGDARALRRPVSV